MRSAYGSVSVDDYGHESGSHTTHCTLLFRRVRRLLFAADPGCTLRLPVLLTVNEQHPAMLHALAAPYPRTVAVVPGDLRVSGRSLVSSSAPGNGPYFLGH